MRQEHRRRRTTLPLLIALIVVLASAAWAQSPTERVERWGVYEVALNGPAEGTPFVDVSLSAEFTNGNLRVKVPGFYDGDGVYRLRFSPGRQGTWTYRTTSNVSELANQEGRFTCVAPSGTNHGPVTIVNTHYLQYADGTPYYAVGTTAYQWTSVKQSIQEKTLQTLAAAPFSKIRMCVFPKWYQYGNQTEPWTYPFAREGKTNDFHRPNYAFFQNFDRRVAQLMDLGIQADVILFHPYDAWGYCQMGAEMNTRYVRYMIARLSAYRNVWWSLANEWDIPRIKTTIDWEGIGSLLQNEDPHQRLRGIHNWYGSEDHFYDHTRPWITHVSTQTSQFHNAIKWRDQYRKPLLFDEMRYEGDVPSGWGNLTAEAMVSYFWMAGLSGGYPTHGDTYRNDADDTTEVRWWAKGGSLPGASGPRIAFFKSVMEKAPVSEMTPVLIDGGDPKNLKTNVYLFSKPGTYHLVYPATGNRTVEIDLGEGEYSMEILDTWNIQITSSEGRFSGKTVIKVPSKPYLALRFIRR